MASAVVEQPIDLLPPDAEQKQEIPGVEIEEKPQDVSEQTPEETVPEDIPEEKPDMSEHQYKYKVKVRCRSASQLRCRR